MIAGNPAPAPANLPMGMFLLCRGGGWLDVLGLKRNGVVSARYVAQPGEYGHKVAEREHDVGVADVVDAARCVARCRRCQTRGSAGVRGQEV